MMQQPNRSNRLHRRFWRPFLLHGVKLERRNLTIIAVRRRLMSWKRAENHETEHHTHNDSLLLPHTPLHLLHHLHPLVLRPLSGIHPVQEHKYTKDCVASSISSQENKVLHCPDNSSCQIKGSFPTTFKRQTSNF